MIAVENYLDSFKKYVPSEFLAGFIAINSLMPHKSPADLYVISGSMIVLMVIFIVSSIKYQVFASSVLMIVVALSLPGWGFVIAADRFEDYFDVNLARSSVSVVLIAVSVALSAFDRATPAFVATDASK